MRRTLAACGALLFTLVFTAPSHAQIVNGGFEQPTSPIGYQLLGGLSTAIDSWTTTDNGVEWFSPASGGYGPAAEGLNVVDLACYVYSAGGIKQTFATIPGQSYQIDFWLGTHARSGRDGTATITVSADAQSQSFSMTNLGPNIVWSQRTFTFVADDASATLQFRCTQNANLHFAYIDGVGASQVVPARTTSWGRVKSMFR